MRFAALTHDLGKGATPPELWPKHHGHEAKSVERVRALSERIRVPADCRDLAVAVARDHGNVHRALELRPGTVVELLERVDAFRRPERFEEFLQACECDFRGRPGYEDKPFPAPDYLRQALQAAQAIDAAEVARRADPGAHPGGHLPGADGSSGGVARSVFDGQAIGDLIARFGAATGITRLFPPWRINFLSVCQAMRGRLLLK